VGTAAGDPKAMRSLAARLRKDSDRVSSRAAWLARRTGRMRFEGPAAEGLRQEMLSARISAEKAAGELREIANRLLSSAARIETDIADAKRLQASGGAAS
jgi:uncharacterized protein YukE